MGVLTTKQASTNPAWAKAIGIAPKARKRPGGAAAMNGLEQCFSDKLLIQVREGSILWFAFNDIRLRIGSGAHYKPDFVVQFSDGRLICYETKGFEREAAMVRIKSAALRYPQITFVLVKRIKGQWVYETIGGER